MAYVPKTVKREYCIRQLDSWCNPDGTWTINQAFELGVMRTSARDVGDAMTNWLRNRQGITFRQGEIRIVDEGNEWWTIELRRSDKPLFDAEPLFYE